MSEVDTMIKEKHPKKILNLIRDAKDAVSMIDDFMKGEATKDDLMTVAINLEEDISNIEKE
jgi:hypothetical protein